MNDGLRTSVLGSTLPSKASGGASGHEKGFFADEAALVSAWPTAEAGDWAILGSTDSIWLWDTDTNAWVDSKYKPEHAKGWYIDEVALIAANPTGVAGDWAIVGSTDTVWVWDTDTNAWIDTGQGAIVNWGDIGGTLSVQTDLQNALDGKVDNYSSTTLSTDTIINNTYSTYLSISSAHLSHVLMEASAAIAGRRYTIVAVGSGPVTVRGYMLQTISGYPSVTFNQGESITVEATSSGWIII